MKANLDLEILSDLSLNKFNVINIPISSLSYNSVSNLVDSISKAKKCKNMFALGLVCWLYDRDINVFLRLLSIKFKDGYIYDINKRVFLSGYNYASTLELFHNQYEIDPIAFNDDSYLFRKISGNQAFVIGAIVFSFINNFPFYAAGYPITPASEILHGLLKYNSYNYTVLQVEDEIAAVTSAIGASYGGRLAFTFTSGPGLDLMTEGIGLAVMAELPLVVIDVQRVGPSTGIPTKSEQTDLLSSIFGRHGESPVVVLAPNSPSDCFWIIMDAFLISIKYLIPVIILADANLANSSELWNFPSIDILLNSNYKGCDHFKKTFGINKTFANFNKNEFKFCIGGLEKNKDTGCVSYDPDNHFKMVKFRNNKISLISKDIPFTNIIGNKYGNLLIITWGSVYGVVRSVYNYFLDISLDYSFFSLVCLRHLNPLPDDLIFIIKNFKKVLVIEENMGHLSFILKSNYFLNVIEIIQVTGKPFSFSYLKYKISEYF